MFEMRYGKWSKNVVLACVSIIFILLIIPQAVDARSYSFPNLTITAEISEDGSMLVTEQRTAKFNGTYRGFFQWINKNNNEEIVDIIVMENGQPFDFNPTTEEGPAGTYFIKNSSDYVYVDWSFEATDEQRTFTLEYRILDVVQVHGDVAEVYHQFVGGEWEVGVDNVQVTLILSTGAELEDIRAWGHGPAHGNVSIESAERVFWEIQRLQHSTPITGRVTFPKELVPNATNTTGVEALPMILEQEQTWADEANLKQTQARINWALTFIIIISGLIYSIYMWMLHGKAYKTDFQGDYYRELPATYSPAELGVLWRFKRVTSDDLTATIMDLARRGYFRIDETTRDVKKLLRTVEAVDYKLTANDYSEDKAAELRPHEKSLLELLFRTVSKDRQTVAFSGLEEYADKNKKTFTVFWEGWNKGLTKRGKELKFFEEHSSGEAGKHAIPGIVMIVIGIALAIWQVSTEGQFAGAALAVLIMGFIQLVSLALHSRRTYEGQQQYVKWKAFRKFLQDFSNMDRHDIPSLVIWEHFLVYAIPLGIAKEVMKQLQLVYPSLEQDNYRFGYGWYYYNVNAANFSGLATSIDTMTSTINQSILQSVATATGQAASGSGAGGGFSGGGGGGGFSGGGGGGAR